MQLQHKFDLPMPAVKAWELLNRVEEITPCLQGASAVAAGDDRFNIQMKLRFGPLDLVFKGVVEITERDPVAHRMVLKTKANDARGQGSASGTTVAQMSELAGTTNIVLDTDLMIGGRIAQMGRGMVGDVSNDLLAKFVANLKAKFLVENTPQQEPTSIPGLSSAPSNTPAPAATEDYVDVGAAVRRAMWRRLLNVIFFWRKTP